jgi:hypothetical protein
MEPPDGGRPDATEDEVMSAFAVGHTVFTASGLRIHHFRGSLNIRDMANAGKRGKAVRELSVHTKYQSDTKADPILEDAASFVRNMSFDEAEQWFKSSDTFRVDKRNLRGVDVEPASARIELVNKLPGGTILTIDATAYDFEVKSSVMFTRTGGTSFRQDTLYSPSGKKDGQLFYAWLRTHLAEAGRSTLIELQAVWRKLGVRYDYH